MQLSRRDFLQATAAGALALTVPHEAQARLAKRQLRELRAAVRGPVLAPGDRGYDGARLVFNRRFDAIRPPAVVRVRDTADVQAVVRWAGRHDVPLVVRSGGNAYNGASTGGDAVVVDVGGLDRFGLEGSVATAGPGLRNFELYRRLARRGLRCRRARARTSRSAGSRPAAAWGSPAARSG